MAGDTHGEHFDNSVVGFRLQDFVRKHSGKDLTQDTLVLVSPFAGFDGSCSLYRARYEVNIKGLFQNAKDGIFEVKAIVGDSHLGGGDFDYCIVDSSLQDFKHGHCGKDIMQDTLYVVSLSERIVGSCSLYRVRFEELNMDVFRNAMGLVESRLRDGGIDKCNLHEVAFVGGSTRIPQVRSMIREFFNGITVVEEISLLLEILHLLCTACFSG